MSADDFEKLLRRQPLRPVPGDWRGEILAASRSAMAPRDAGADPAPWIPRLRDWLWPNPVAWGALAACWLATLVLNQLAQPSPSERARAERDASLAAAYYAAVRDPAALTLLADPRPREAVPASRRPRPGVGQSDGQFLLSPV